MDSTINMQLLIAVVTVVVNAAVTKGVVSTELRWLRRDVDAAHKRIDQLRNGQPDHFFTSTE